MADSDSPAAVARLGRFDRAVVLALAGLALFAGLLAWGGDRAGLRVVEMYPAVGATGVSTQPILRLTFAQDLAPDPGVALAASPPVSGTLRWRGRTLEWRPGAALLPDTLYQLTLPAGLQSRQGRPLLRPVEWRFRTGRPRVLYLAWNEQGYNQLFVVGRDGRGAAALTAAEWGVLDYALAPGGDQIAYSAHREDRGTDLWLFDLGAATGRLLLGCPEAACSSPAWAPDGRRLIYERRNLDQSGLPPGPPRLWWLDIGTGETVPVFADSQWLGSSARFSPDGRYISYVAPLAQAVELYDLQTSESRRIASRTGEPAAWSPDGTTVLVSDVDLGADQYAIRLLRQELAAGTSHSISGGEPTADGWPAFSPDGAWLAFNRKPAGGSGGSQIWLMRPDGGRARPLTDEPAAQFGPPAWSPDGRTLLFQRYTPAEPGAEPGIWLVDLDAGRLRPVVAVGTQPAWLP